MYACDNKMLYHLFLVLGLSSLSAASSSSTTTTSTHETNNKLPQERQQPERELQSLFRYSPVHPIEDQAAIDLDQQEIENELIKAAYDGQDSAMVNALNIYSYGAHSRPYARIELDSALTYTTQAGAPVRGHNMAGIDITGTLLGNVQAGSTTVEVLYPITSDNDNGNGQHADCQVGASMNPIFDGCFSVQGELVVGNNAPISYSYDISFDNHNDRTIRRFSLNAENEIFLCNNATEGLPQNNNCPYTEILKYYNYYGEFDYADTWITSALRAGDTSFANNMGNSDFSLVGDVGRAQAAGSGTVYLNVWMYVIGKMNNAIHDCYEYCSDSTVASCSDFNKRRIIQSWDEAVAYYTGSLQQDDPATNNNGASDAGNNNNNNHFGGSEGYLLYQLANDRCMNYYTCGPDGDQPMGESKINYDIFDLFINGQQDLLNGNCDAMIPTKQQIVSYMVIPLIQGLIRSAYTIGEVEDRAEHIEAEGATYAAALLPLIHSCSTEDAVRIHHNMRIWGRQSNESIPLVHFYHVKHALENNYQCLGITCDDVGGLVDLNPLFFDSTPVGGSGSSTSPSSGSRTYLDGARPCNDVQRDSMNDNDNREPLPHTTTTTTTTTTTQPNTPGSTPPPPPKIPNPPNNNNNINSPHRDHHHHFYTMGEFSVGVQIGICLGFFFLMLCITLLCCLSWRVPHVEQQMEGLTPEYGA